MTGNDVEANPWSLAITAPQRESFVAEFFTKHGYPFHWFRERCAVRGKIIRTLRPLFPRYIFVRAMGEWRLLQENTPVIGFVSFGGQLAAIGERIVNDLLVACPGGIAPMVEAPSRFKRGDLVDIKAGPFAGHHAAFVRTISRDQSVLWIDIFGRSVPISVMTDDLTEHVPDPPTVKRKRYRPHRRRSHEMRIQPVAVPAG